MHERDSQCLAMITLNQLSRRRRHRVFIQTKQDLAVGVNSLRNLQTAATRNEGRRHFQKQIIEIVACLAADLDRIAKALRCEQADGGARAFDDRIGYQRRSVHQAVQIGRFQFRLLQDTGDACDNGNAGIVGRREQLSGVDEIAGRIMQHQIREGPANIDTDACRARFRRHAHSSP